MSDMKMYDILGKFNNLDPQFKPLDQVERASQPVYQEVDPRGSITQGVKKLTESFESFKLNEKAPLKKKSKEKEFDPKLNWAYALASQNAT